MTVRSNLLIYLATFNILANIGSHIEPEVVVFNKILHSVLSVVVHNRGIILFFYYPNTEIFRNIKFSLIK